jgi:hypothetical protein
MQCAWAGGAFLEIMGPCWPPGLEGPFILGMPQAHKIIKEGRQFATLIVQTPQPKAPLGLSFWLLLFGDLKPMKLSSPKFQRYIHTYIHAQFFNTYLHESSVNICQTHLHNFI